MECIIKGTDFTVPLKCYNLWECLDERIIRGNHNHRWQLTSLHFQISVEYITVDSVKDEKSRMHNIVRVDCTVAGVLTNGTRHETLNNRNSHPATSAHFCDYYVGTPRVNTNREPGRKRDMRDTDQLHANFTNCTKRDTWNCVSLLVTEYVAVSVPLSCRIKSSCHSVRSSSKQGYAAMNFYACIREMPGSNFGHTEVFRAFLHSLQAHSERVPQIRRRPLPQNRYQFTVHESSYHYTLYSPSSWRPR